MQNILVLDITEVTCKVQGGGHINFFKLMSSLLAVHKYLLCQPAYCNSIAFIFFIQIFCIGWQLHYCEGRRRNVIAQNCKPKCMLKKKMKAELLISTYLKWDHTYMGKQRCKRLGSCITSNPYKWGSCIALIKK